MECSSDPHILLSKANDLGHCSVNVSILLLPLSVETMVLRPQPAYTDPLDAYLLLHENVDNHTLTYVNQLDAVLLDRVEGNCDVLKGVGLGLGVLDYVYVHT